MFDRIQFAAKRRKAQDDLIAALEPVVGRALDRKQDGADTWWRTVVDAAKPLFDSVVRDDGGDPGKAAPAWARLALDLTHALTKTKHVDEYSHTLVATWVAAEILSAATIAAVVQGEETFELEWISMHDSKVRHTHRQADGQRIKPGDKFRVGTAELRYPGDSTAPMKEWVNCRCTLAAVPVTDIGAASVDTEAGLERGAPEMSETTTEAPASRVDPTGLIPWHGVLAPEGVWSGDKRMFAEGALSNRDLPLPLTYQKVSDEGHKGSVTVGSIDWLEKRGNMMHAGGVMLETEEADEAVGLLAHFGKFGVSVDADAADFDLDEEEDGIVFTMARICSAAMVQIPAFAQAYIRLGTDPDYQPAEESLAASIEEQAGTLTLGQSPIGVIKLDVELAAISDKSWDGSASRFTPEQWKRSCVLHLDDSLNKSSHKLPIKEPNGDLSRAGVHAAAGRVGQVDAPSDKVSAARRALRSAYSTLGEDPPEGLAFENTVVLSIEELTDVPEDSVCLHDDCTNPPTKVVSTDDPDWFALFCDEHAAEHEDQSLDWAADLVTAGRGPGWITNPVDTKRIHDYWTVPGQPGYEKVGWGTDGDFNRCRVEVGQEIGENSPEKLRFINQICAQWHHDATGFWPGDAPAERGHALAAPEGEQAPAISLVASADTVTPPAEWFRDPGLTEPTPITITEDGHIFGHVADFSVCHMSFTEPGQCIQVHPSTNGYAYYRMGEVVTDEGPVATGVVTLATKHAGRRLGLRAALSHYDDTGNAVADVVCGDDDIGVWINGWVRPWISDEKKYELRAHPPSGDWRRNPNTGEMDMIGVLSVNAPGLPVRRVGIDNGVQVSLVASLTTSEVDPDSPITELAEAVAAAIEDREERRRTIEELAHVFEEV